MGFVIMKSKFKKEKGKKFPLYQQNKQPPLTLKLLNTKKKTMMFSFGNPCSWLETGAKMWLC
jgi:hypothetical protein